MTPSELPRTAQAVVIGGGVMGAGALYYLTRLGVDAPVLLERDTLASGSTGRSMAILRFHYSNQVTARMAVEGRRVIANFEDEIGAPSGFVNTGYALLAGEGMAEALRKNVMLSRRVGARAEALTPQGALSFLPSGFRLSQASAVAFEPDGGYADTSAVTSGFAQAARHAGAKVFLDTGAQEVVVEKGRVSGVRTGRGVIATRRVILCAGPWTNDLLDPLGAGLPLSWVRHQVVQLRGRRDVIQSLPIVADVPHGMSFRQDADEVLLIGIREDPADREGYNRSVDAAVAREGMAGVIQRVPKLEDLGWEGGWSGLFTTTPDWHPVIDSVPGIEGLVCGAGFSGHGFKLSPAVGRALAEIAVNGSSTTIDVSPLRFTRFDEGALLFSAYGNTVFA